MAQPECACDHVRMVSVNKRRYPLKTLIGAPYRSVWEASRKGTNQLLPLKEKPKLQDIADLDPLGGLHVLDMTLIDVALT